ncbi:transglutaminase-like cysteine peptidase [Aestuariivirga sp.]|uniref:transglutaminase-like cysteine peptidase n=1 Tax=Aestuariivirga sp. TaxID=2650926 RepID=UPI00391A4AE4
MKNLGAAGAVFLALALGTQGAEATGSLSEARGARLPAQFAETFDKTLPPVGFVGFCARNAEECRSKGLRSSRIGMTSERWRLLFKVNSFVNGKVAPVSDEELYGEAEYWAYPADAGDCEDYVLMKKRYLERLGFARSALLITVVLDEKNEGHAVLMVATEEGDFVLDNRRNEIRRWSDLDYTYLKRQSQRDPRVWVSLGGEESLPSGVVAAGTEK